MSCSGSASAWPLAAPGLLEGLEPPAGVEGAASWAAALAARQAVLAAVLAAGVVVVVVVLASAAPPGAPTGGDALATHLAAAGQLQALAPDSLRPWAPLPPTTGGSRSSVSPRAPPWCGATVSSCGGAAVPVPPCPAGSAPGPPRARGPPGRAAPPWPLAPQLAWPAPLLSPRLLLLPCAPTRVPRSARCAPGRDRRGPGARGATPRILPRVHCAARPGTRGTTQDSRPPRHMMRTAPLQVVPPPPPRPCHNRCKTSRPRRAEAAWGTGTANSKHPPAVVLPRRLFPASL